jgi:phosphatidylglycerophosphate synthase
VTVLPLGGLVVLLVGSMFVFGARSAAGRVAFRASPQSGDGWWLAWWVWLSGPVTRACAGRRVSPHAISLVGALLALSASLLAAWSHLATGGWLYLAAVTLDLVDGRVARARGEPTRAGAFLDSALDRLGELVFLVGLAVQFAGTAMSQVALVAAASSVLLAYARARGEALGVPRAARAGGLHRAARTALVAVPCALTPLVDAAAGPGSGRVAVASALALLAVTASIAAVRRGWSVWSALRCAESPARGANVFWLDPRRARERLRR